MIDNHLKRVIAKVAPRLQGSKHEPVKNKRLRLNSAPIEGQKKWQDYAKEAIDAGKHEFVKRINALLSFINKVNAERSAESVTLRYLAYTGYSCDLPYKLAESRG